MEAKSQRPEGREGSISALNEAIEALDPTKISNIPPAKVVFNSVTALLTLIRDSRVNKSDYVELGLHCADACRALDRGMNGKRLDELSQPVHEEIQQLTLTVADIQRKLVKWDKRNVFSRYFHARKDKKTIAAWRFGLGRILQDFNNELAVKIDTTIPLVHRDVANTSTIVSGVQDDVTNTNIVSDSHRRTQASAPGESPPPPPPEDAHGTVPELEPDVTSTVMPDQGGGGSNDMSTQTSMPGESPPLPPTTLFGRDELVEEAVDLAENLVPIALIGAGGIGKTSVALTVFHHDRIKQRFGDERRFIRCDQFPASRVHLLHGLSRAISAGIEYPQDLTPLRPFLSSKEMLIILDNAEFILDSQGTDGQEIRTVVEELCGFNNVCVCIASRTPATPAGCRRLDVPTLSMAAARDTFHQIYDSNNQSNLVDGILELLDFHPLSIILLATAARQNKWDTNRLTGELERLGTSMVQTEHSKGLAVAIELSLTSPPLQELGPDARALLGVVAFFPLGVNEDNLDRVFPTIPNRTKVFDKFCTLSLTYRRDGFTTMLAPLRDYFSPKDPKSSQLLCTTKEHYFARISASTDRDDPNSIGTRWITSEDLNVEHLLDVFTAIDGDSDGVWNACASFMEYLVQRKRGFTILQPRIEALPDDHLSKPECLFLLSQLFDPAEDQAEPKRLVTHALKLERERGNERGVAQKLRCLANLNRDMRLYGKGIEQAKEALKICEQLGDMVAQAECLNDLAWLLESDRQIHAAEEAASRAIGLIPEEGNESVVFRSHYILGKVYKSREKMEAAVYHYEAALGIASAFGWHDLLFEVHFSMAELFFDGLRFDDAKACLDRAKLYAVNNKDYLYRVTEKRFEFLSVQCGLGALISGNRSLFDALRTAGGGSSVNSFDQDSRSLIEEVLQEMAKEPGKEQLLDLGEEHKIEEVRSEALRTADAFEELGAREDMEDCRQFFQCLELSDAATAPGSSGFSRRGIK